MTRDELTDWTSLVAAWREARRGKRHTPDVDAWFSDAEGRLLGLISIGDLNAQLQATHEQTVFLLTEYIQGRA